MPYPEEFEGFMINEIGKDQDFRKQSVRAPVRARPPSAATHD